MFPFFFLVFALSIPLWLIGATTDLQLLPGLPLSSQMWWCPGAAAAILVWREQGRAGVKALLMRVVDGHRIRKPLWYIPILLLMPAIMVASWGVMRLRGVPVPGPRFPVLGGLLLFLAFVVAGLGEELGWSGYIIEPMQRRWDALRASILLGVVWSVWHLVPLLQVQRSLAWIGWWCLYTIALRVLIVWLFNNTGKSVLAAALFHATTNLGWQLFPIAGSYFDPAVTGPIVALVAVAVTLIAGPRTLVRSRPAPIP